MKLKLSRWYSMICCAICDIEALMICEPAAGRTTAGANSDHRAYRPCHQRDCTAGTRELIYPALLLSPCRDTSVTVTTTGRGSRMERQQD